MKDRIQNTYQIANFNASLRRINGLLEATERSQKRLNWMKWIDEHVSPKILFDFDVLFETLSPFIRTDFNQIPRKDFIERSQLVRAGVFRLFLNSLPEIQGSKFL